MEIFFYMDHAEKACVTLCPNLVTNHVILRKMRHIRSVALQRNCLRADG